MKWNQVRKLWLHQITDEPSLTILGLFLTICVWALLFWVASCHNAQVEDDQSSSADNEEDIVFELTFDGEGEELEKQVEKLLKSIEHLSQDNAPELSHEERREALQEQIAVFRTKVFRGGGGGKRTLVWNIREFSF